MIPQYNNPITGRPCATLTGVEKPDYELESEQRITESQLIIANQEIERLKGLVKSKIHCGQPDCKPCNDLWEIYKKENNL